MTAPGIAHGSNRALASWDHKLRGNDPGELTLVELSLAFFRRRSIHRFWEWNFDLVLPLWLWLWNFERIGSNCSEDCSARKCWWSVWAGRRQRVVTVKPRCSNWIRLSSALHIYLSPHLVWCFLNLRRAHEKKKHPFWSDVSLHIRILTHLCLWFCVSIITIVAAQKRTLRLKSGWAKNAETLIKLSVTDQN